LAVAKHAVQAAFELLPVHFKQVWWQASHIKVFGVTDSKYLSVQVQYEVVESSSRNAVAKSQAAQLD
jgi:hypothetical protein